MKITNEPFFIVPSKVFSLGLTPYELSVLFYLCMRADNEKHTCWPSEKLMARECGMSVSTINRGLHSLEEKKLIEIVPQYHPTANGLKRQAANLYRILLFDFTPPVTEKDTPYLTEHHPLSDIHPPLFTQTREINKTKPNITKSNITKPTELRSSVGEDKEKIYFLKLKDDCLKMLEVEFGVDASLCELAEKSLLNLWSRESIEHEGRDLSSEDVHRILRNDLTAGHVKRALDYFTSTATSVRSPVPYLAKCIFSELTMPQENKWQSLNSSALDVNDFFAAALRKSYGED